MGYNAVEAQNYAEHPVDSDDEQDDGLVTPSPATPPEVPYLYLPPLPLGVDDDGMVRREPQQIFLIGDEARSAEVVDDSEVQKPAQQRMRTTSHEPCYKSYRPTSPSLCR